jgi:hypothetical protein
MHKSSIFANVSFLFLGTLLTVSAVGDSAFAMGNSGGGFLNNDGDGDGIADRYDNCIEVINRDQADSDRDGYGNACDPDINNDGRVTFGDLVDWGHAGASKPIDLQVFLELAGASLSCLQDCGYDVNLNLLFSGSCASNCFPPDLVVPGPSGLGASSDGDGFIDDFDNCPDAVNPAQTDSDEDGLGDACDPEPCTLITPECHPWSMTGQERIDWMQHQTEEYNACVALRLLAQQSQTDCQWSHRLWISRQEGALTKPIGP